MSQENAVESPAEIPAAEVKETVQAAYDRVANPGKVQEEVTEEIIVPTAETPPGPALTADEIKELKAQVARIPDLEKRLRDDGGRYGALKQMLDQIQQRFADKKEQSGADFNVDDVLADIKEEFGEDGLYQGLKSAFSKMANGRSVDPDAIEKIVARKISEAKQAERSAAFERLTEAHPEWDQIRVSPELEEWTQTLSPKEREKFRKSDDPDYVAGRLDVFAEWKAKKPTTPPPEAKPEPKPEPKPGPSKRLASAVLPTTGTKPKAVGDDKQAQINAAYNRVAGNRR